MSRMKLHKSVRLGAYEVYPIYEVNFTDLKELSGYTLVESSDNVSPNANKFRRWTLVNNDIPSHTDSFPRQPTESGVILPCDTRYNNLIDDRYYMPHDTLASFAEIERGVRPEDWGANPNYIILNNIDDQSFNNSPSGGFGTVKVCIPEPVNIYETWSATTRYFEDTQRLLVRKFFLEDGKSFAVSKGGYHNYNRWLGVSFGNGTLTSFPSGTSNYDNRFIGYYFTRSDGTVIDRHYKAEYAYGITGIDSGADYDWPTWQNGKNITQFFVHYVENGTTDFYGIAIAQMDNFLETASPIAIDVVAFDAQWWGASIISGGGGSGQWTTDGPTSYVQGGRGSFEAPSDNHGDSAGASAKSIASTWSANHSPFDQGYNKYILSSPDATAFKQMVDNLVDPDVWQGFDNKYYNPIDSIITCSMIPANLAPSGSDIGTSSVIKASKLNLTTATVPTFTIWNKAIHIGSVDIRSYCDGFPDYDNTTIYINLPYIGVKQLDINACMEGELAVDYLIDYLTSDITAQIWVRDRFGNYNIRYEYKGNCGKQIPLTQIVPRSTQIVGGLHQAAIPLAAGAVVGTIGGLTAGFTEGAKRAAGAAGFVMPSSAGSVGGAVVKSGLSGIGSGFTKTFGSTMKALGTTGAAFGAASSAMSSINASQQMASSNANGGAVSSPVNTQCYVLITRPMWSAPEEYGKQFGYPSDISGTINVSDTEGGDPFTNFLSVRSIILDGMTCLPEEKVEIENLMKAGVYTTNE